MNEDCLNCAAHRFEWAKQEGRANDLHAQLAAALEREKVYREALGNLAAFKECVLCTKMSRSAEHDLSCPITLAISQGSGK